MTLDEFRASLTGRTPPGNISPALRALWYDARGDWNTAHEAAQDMTDSTGAWIHAYLHRKEGDESNAAYRYRRAGQPVARDSLDAEWERIATTLLTA